MRFHSSYPLKTPGAAELAARHTGEPVERVTWWGHAPAKEWRVAVARSGENRAMRDGWTRSHVEALADPRSLTCGVATNAGEPARFTDLLTKVRAEHARKRILMTLIDKNRWT